MTDDCNPTECRRLIAEDEPEDIRGLIRQRDVLADQLEAACKEVAEKDRWHIAAAKERDSMRAELSLAKSTADNYHTQVGIVSKMYNDVASERDSLRQQLADLHLHKVRELLDAKPEQNLHEAAHEMRNRLESLGPVTLSLHQQIASGLDAIGHIRTERDALLASGCKLESDLAAAQRRIAELERERDSLIVIQRASGHDVAIQLRNALHQIAELEAERSPALALPPANESAQTLVDSVMADSMPKATSTSRLDERDTLKARVARVAELEAESLKWYQAAADGIDSLLEHGLREQAVLTATIRAILPVYQSGHDWVYRGQGFRGALVTAIHTARARITPEIAAMLAKMEKP